MPQIGVFFLYFYGIINMFYYNNKYIGDFMIKYEKKNCFEKLNKYDEENMYKYTDEYINFLNVAKTEYKCVEYIVNELKENGFKDLNDVDKLSLGDKVYFVNKERSLYAAIIGKNELKAGVNIIGAHIDSPRLDTKPMPLFENEGLALMKTQYYGGIKKYQWLTIPLALYGVIYNSKGEKIDVVLGEDEDEFTFVITDILPHLGKEQLDKKASEFIDPENLNVVVGSIPDFDEKENKIKGKILKELNKKYGITEIDFARSDIRFVPSFKAKYIGLDKGLVAGYGQDDRVCSYATISSLINIAKEEKKLDRTAIGLLIDKEEIGSEGNTSMSSDAFELFIAKLLRLKGEMFNLEEIRETLNNSRMLSADVSAAVDPMYDHLSDIQNGNLIGCGIALEKYTGSGGKYSANDASAKFMSEVMNIFEKENVSYQIGTLGKIWKGGGGTIAYILANKGVEVVDCGTALLSMHSPYEVASTADIYMTYKAYKAFFKS